MCNFFKIFSAGTLLLAAASGPLFSQTVNFEKQVWPILEKKCVQCHKAPYEENGRTVKPKAGLRLDGAWAIMLGSEDGAVLKPRDSAHSELYTRTNLPPDDDDFMPPAGKADPLTDEEKSLLSKWIDQGADFSGWAGNLEGKPKELSNTGSKIPTSEVQELYKSLSNGLTPLEEKAWKDVTAAGARVMPLAQDSPLLSVDFRLTSDEATDEKIHAVAAIAPHVAHLDLSKSKVTDASLADIAKMERLVRLDLHRTAVTDAGIAQLKGLKHLRYLNLYGTQVGDPGLDQLKGLKNLRSVYLWNSKATEQGVKALEAALPGVKISLK